MRAAIFLMLLVLAVSGCGGASRAGDAGKLANQQRRLTIAECIERWNGSPGTETMASETPSGRQLLAGMSSYPGITEHVIVFELSNGRCGVALQGGGETGVLVQRNSGAPYGLLSLRLVHEVQANPARESEVNACKEAALELERAAAAAANATGTRAGRLVEGGPLRHLTALEGAECGVSRTPAEPSQAGTGRESDSAPESGQTAAGGSGGAASATESDGSAQYATKVVGVFPQSEARKLGVQQGRVLCEFNGGGILPPNGTPARVEAGSESSCADGLRIAIALNGNSACFGGASGTCDAAGFSCRTVRSTEPGVGRTAECSLGAERFLVTFPP